MNPRLPLRLTLVALSVIPALSVLAQGNSPLFNKPLQPLTPSKRGVIFKAPDSNKFGHQCSRQSPAGTWSSTAPSKTEIQALEKALPAWLKTHQLKNWKTSFETFHYQYGALMRGKKRLIYVNALPAADDFGAELQLWRRSPQVVCDGGSSFWGIEYDVKTKHFQNPSFNGPF